MTATRTPDPHDIVRGLGLTGAPLLEPAPQPVPLSSRLAVGDLAWAAVGAASLAAAEIAGAARVTLDPDRIALAYGSERHGTVDGHPPVAFAPLSGFFPTADGWVRTHGNYPHHARALLGALGLGDAAGVEQVRSALAAVDAQTAARAVVGRGGICAVVSTENADAERSLRTEPLLRVERLAASPPRALDPSPTAPLRGIRVLDLTRVIAGPVATRTLALLGADVLRVDPPDMPEIPWQHLDTGHGKRSTLLDLRASSGAAAFERLAADADVVVLGYRPVALDRLGLSPRALAARHPGLVVARLSAWGRPDERGFDSIVQAASGIAWIESRDGVVPGALPAQALDHSAGYLLAAAIMGLLVRRSAEGGSWGVETSLRRVATELLGMPRTTEPSEFTTPPTTGHTQTFEIAGQPVTTVGPAVAFEGGPAVFAPPRPWGADEPRWLGP